MRCSKRPRYLRPGEAVLGGDYRVGRLWHAKAFMATKNGAMAPRQPSDRQSSLAPPRFRYYRHCTLAAQAAT